ncbi:MAG: PAS domain-containing protein [Anaerolineae bacterium]|nr:PAS domain-containing protein [Anaerolineae bacterium]
MNTIEPTLQHTLAHDTAPGAPLKARDLDFYNLLRRQSDESRLFFNGRRAVIFDAEAIGTLRQQLIESLGLELAMGVLTRFGYSQGWGDAARLADNFNWETDMDWLAAGPSLHMLEGVVHVQPEFIEFNRETGYFHMHGAWLNSYEAEEHLRRFGESTRPVCWTLTGYASGYATRFFGQEVLAIETECVGKGDARCYWEIRPVDAWGAEAEPYRAALKQIDISNQLVETNQRLQEQVAENTRLFQQTGTVLAEQEQLLAELRKLSRAVEQSRNTIVITDIKGYIEYANPRFVETTGYTLEEAIGQHTRILSSGETPQEEYKQLWETITAGKEWRGEFHNKKKNGDLYWETAFISPIKNTAGEITHFLAVKEEITERKRAEEANAERARMNTFTAEISLALIQNAALTSMLKTCTEAMVTHLDAAFARIWTFNPTENVLELQASAGIYTHIDGPHRRVPVGKFKIGLIAQERKPHLTNDVLNDPRLGDKAWAEREGMVAFAGYPLIVEDRLVGVMAMFARHPLADTVLEAMQSVANMVALSIDHKHVEETMQASQKFLQDVLDSMPSPVYVLDNRGRFMLINQVFAKLFNLDQAAVIGKTDFDVFARGKAEEFQSNALEILRAGVPVEVEEQFDFADGSYTYLTHKYPLHDVNGEPYALAAISIDITERKKTEQTLAKRAAELETIARVSTAAASLLDTDELLQEVVDLTKQSFYLYHAHIYLLNKAEHKLELAAGAGEVGRQMVAKGWAIPLDRPHSLVALAARTRQAVIVNNVRLAPDFMPNPLLPETRSEMAVPLIVGDNVLGVLDVQADTVNRFTEEDKQIILILAGQIAVALRNASLYQQTQAALTDLKQSQELLRTTIDATPDWIFIKDRQHRYQLVNQGFANSLHLPVEALIGKNDLEVGFPEDVVKGNPEEGIRGFWADDDEVMNSASPKFVQVEPGFVDGQPVFLSTFKAPLFDSNGNVWGVLGFVRDITEREQILTEAEKLYEASRRINEANNSQEIVAAIVEELSAPAINRAILLMFEYDSLGEVEIMEVTANWYSGKGNLPTPIGVQYSKAEFATPGFLFSATPLFFDDIQHDERIDPATITLLQQLNIQSMAVLPLWVGSRQLGSLLLETEELYKFTERDIRINRSLIGQAAVAIDNLRLLEEARTALAEVEITQRRYTVQAWEAYRNKLTTLSYEETREGVPALDNDLLPVINRVVQQQLAARASNGQGDLTRPQALVSSQLVENAQLPEVGSSVIVPLTVRGEPIGVLGLQEIDQQRVWSPEEIALIEAISEQLAQAAENIRLIDETQQQAAREKRVNEIGEKIQAAQSLEEALKIAVKEVGLSLQAPQTVVKLEVR